MKFWLFVSAALVLTPGVASAQGASTTSTPSGGALGAAGATSLGTSMSTTGAGNLPNGNTPSSSAPTPPPAGPKATTDNMPGNAGARGLTGVGSTNP